MATTGAPGNIPLMDDNSPITPIQAPFNAIATAVNDALTRGGIGDTGWITPTITEGTPDQGTPPAYRRFNGIVYLMGVWTPSTSNQVCFNLPAGFRPKQQVQAIVYRNGNAAPARVAANGDVMFYTGASGSVNWASFPAFIPEPA